MSNHDESSNAKSNDLNLGRRNMLKTMGVGVAAAVAATTAASVMATTGTEPTKLAGAMGNDKFNTNNPYPRTFSHIGVSVPNLEEAVKFYSEVLGWYVIMEPTEVKEDDSAIGVMCTDVFGAGWERFRIAHMSTGDRIGLELFEFKNQQNPEDNFEYWKTGIFHFSVQDPNVEELAEKIVAAGGKKRMKAPRYYFPGEKPYRMIYMEDPFGNIIEIYSHSYELQYSSGAYS